MHINMDIQDSNRKRDYDYVDVDIPQQFVVPFNSPTDNTSGSTSGSSVAINPDLSDLNLAPHKKSNTNQSNVEVPNFVKSLVEVHVITRYIFDRDQEKTNKMIAQFPELFKSTSKTININMPYGHYKALNEMVRILDINETLPMFRIDLRLQKYINDEIKNYNDITMSPDIFQGPMNEFYRENLLNFIKENDDIFNSKKWIFFVTYYIDGMNPLLTTGFAETILNDLSNSFAEYMLKHKSDNIINQIIKTNKLPSTYENVQIAFYSAKDSSAENNNLLHLIETTNNDCGWVDLKAYNTLCLTGNLPSKPRQVLTFLEWELNTFQFYENDGYPMIQLYIVVSCTKYNIRGMGLSRIIRMILLYFAYEFSASNQIPIHVSTTYAIASDSQHLSKHLGYLYNVDVSSMINKRISSGIADYERYVELPNSMGKTYNFILDLDKKSPSYEKFTSAMKKYGIEI
jgi:hypothetical protein